MTEPIQRVLVIVAHPDDAEARAGGTVAKFTKAGTHVTYAIMTNGDKGSADRTMTWERLARHSPGGATERSPRARRRNRGLLRFPGL